MRARVPVLTLLGLLVTLLVLVAARPAAAEPAPQDVTDEVADVFAKDMLPWVVEKAEGKDTDTIGTVTGVDSIRASFAFTIDFLRGERDTEPITATQRWCGVLRAGRTGVGIAHVEQRDGAIRPVWFTVSPDIAARLDANPAGYYVVGPPQIGSWVLTGQTLTAIDEPARRVAAEPLSLAAAQPLLHERWAAARGNRPGLAQIGMIIIAALLFIGIGLVLIARANAAGRRGRGSPPAARLAG